MALISLVDWNAQVSETRSNVTNVPNGIACPDCGLELVDVDKSILILTDPQTLEIACTSCPYTGTRLA